MMPPPPPPPPPHPHHNPHMLESNGRYQRKPQPIGAIVFLNVVNALTQLLIGAVACCAFTFASIFESSAFPQHIYLNVIGYVILMSQAILSFNSHAGWAYSLKYSQKKLIHSAWQVVGAVFAIAGSIIALVETGASLQSAHGITGLVAMVLTFLSLIGGIFNFILSANNNNSLFMSMHTCIGSLTITVAFICLCLGFTEWYRLIFGDINANVAITFTVFALAGILISGFFRTIQRIIGD